MWTIVNYRCLVVLMCAHVCSTLSEGSTSILSFSVETAKTPYMTGQYLTLQCLAKDNHSVIEIRRTHPKISISRSQGGHILKYTMPSVTCADVGIYECTADHEEPKTTDIALSDCGPCLCYDDEVGKIIFVDINETSQFSFCVVAYMGIHSYLKINNSLVTKGSSVANNSLVTKNSTWSWNYVEINSSRGESSRFNITVTRDQVAIEDYGLQVIRVSASSGTLYFMDYNITLQPKGPSECPTNITVEGQGLDYILLSWIPGLDGGSSQNFHAYYSTDSKTWHKHDTDINDASVYINGLQASTAYYFKVISSNQYTGDVDETVCDNMILTRTADPILTLECSDTSVKEGKQFSCTCKEAANTFILPKATLFYGTEHVGSSIWQVRATVTAHRSKSKLTCQAQLPDGTTATKTKTVQVYFEPTIIIFEANNNSGHIILEKKFSVGISCQAEGNPPPSLSLRKDETLLKNFSGSPHKFNLTLTYNKAMAECTDTGVYMCHAETGQAATNKTVAVYVKCAQQFTDPDNLSHSYKGQVNRTVSISVPVFGYPEPTVTLNSTKYILSSESYKLHYITQGPPYGTVSLMINIKNARFFQNYNLNMKNDEGTLTYSFEIVEGAGSEKSGSPPLAVGAMVGGIVAAVLVIIIVAAIICLLRRKGAVSKGKEHQYVDIAMHTIYRHNESEDIPDAQTPENPYYEEIIDFQSDMPDKPDYSTNQILSTKHDGGVDYANTVSGLHYT